MNNEQLKQIFEDNAVKINDPWGEATYAMTMPKFIEVVSKLLSANNNAEIMAVDDDAIKAMAEKEYPNRLGGPHDINFAIAQPAYIKGYKQALANQTTTKVDLSEFEGTALNKTGLKK